MTDAHEPDASPPLTDGEMIALAGFVPEPFGKYYLLDRIAVGGMAEVFRAKTFGEAGFSKVLVIKRILERYSRDPEFVEMFIQEAKLSAQLSHPNIVQVFDFGRQGDHYFIAMELVEGKDLKTLLKRLAHRGERLPVRTAAYLAYELAKGLAHAHSLTDSAGLPLNVVHRDVSPSNVLIGYDGQVKIVDFGIAEVESGRSQPSESAVLKGKYSYMSPEQTESRELDARSDLFSAGICLWEMLTAARLFKAPTEAETLDKIRRCEVPSARALNPEVPENLEAIVYKALARNPELRYRDADALVAALGDFLAPETPARIRPVVQTFLSQQFAVELAAERQAFDAGGKLAAELHYGDELDLDFDEDESPVLPLTGEGTETFAATPGKKPFPLVFVIMLVLAGVVAAVWLWPKPVAPLQLGTLVVDIVPVGLEGVELLLDGEPITSPWDQVSPNEPHEVMARAPGYVGRGRTVELVPGQTYGLELALVAEPLELEEPEPAETPEPVAARPRAVTESRPKEEARPEEEARRKEEARPTPVAEAPEPVAAALPPIVYFRTDPPGADVVLDGVVIGSAPLEWRAGSAGDSHAVRFEFDGYEGMNARLTVPRPGGSIVVSRRLEEKRTDATPGKLNVQVTPGWAKVYVDGAYVATTPLIGHALPPGTHQLRILSERLGIDQTETVTVRAGETSVKAYSFDR